MDEWDFAADLRRSQIESGEDITFCNIFRPLYGDIFKGIHHSNVLEIGGGTGHLAKLIPTSNNITFTEPSQGMFFVAKKVLRGTNINFVNDKFENCNFNEKYDVIFSHMCFQCICDIDCVLSKIRLYLKQDGLFYFAIPHPCFYEEYKKFSQDNEYSYCESKQFVFDLKIGISDNAVPSVVYYHRPLSFYINSLYMNGFHIIKMNEIFPSEEIQKLYSKMWDTPRYIFFEVKRGKYEL